MKWKKGLIEAVYVGEFMLKSLMMFFIWLAAGLLFIRIENYDNARVLVISGLVYFPFWIIKFFIETKRNHELKKRGSE